MKDLTTQEMLDLLTEWGCDFIEDGNKFYAIAPAGAQTRLDAENYDSAVMEAYSLLKP